MPPRLRRTQAERRATTVAALLDAAVSSLVELGYAATTTKEVTRRAGISQGGLFRHFATRHELMVAAADEVRRRQFESFAAALERLGDATVEDCLVLLRQACRAPMNAAWYELIVAARTDRDLHDALAPMAARYMKEIVELGRGLPATAGVPDDQVESTLLSIVHLLDGEAMLSVLDPHPELEDQRMDQLARALKGLPLWDPAD